MTDKTRTFIALELNPQIQQQIKKFSNLLVAGKLPGIRWVNPESVHITLKFLGDSTDAQVKDVVKILDSLVLKYKPIPIDVNGVGAFPTWSHPRVIWVGVLAPSSLSQLYMAIDDSVSKLGYLQERRRFSPHLTIARISDRTDDKKISIISRLLQEHQNTPFGSATIDRMVLFKSTLQPGGSIYTPLSIHQFKGDG
jgi:RNA 2',3'-cyclic 3'-phosphodiesterase